MATPFEAATAVIPVADGRYAATIAGGWEISGNANGGYLLAMAARAMADAVGRPPLSVTAHYLAPGRSGPCEVVVEVLRDGRRMATVEARLIVGGSVVLVALGVFGQQVAGGPDYIGSVPPDLPPFDECVAALPSVLLTGFAERVHSRLHPDDAGFRAGRPSGRPELRGWFALADTRRDEFQFDELVLLLAADSFAPVCFQVPGVPLGWAPTLELTVHVRRRPQPGVLRCRFSTRFLQDGMFEESGELWDSADNLVAESFQLALTPRSSRPAEK
jgi:acyl-CoA thioesterase